MSQHLTVLSKPPVQSMSPLKSAQLAPSLCARNLLHGLTLGTLKSQMATLPSLQQA